MLEVRDVQTAYGRSQVLFGISLSVGEGQVATLLGRQNNYGNQLSGGEQQMLAIARALMTNPRLLILDEATEGLAPLVRAEIYRSIGRLKAEGLSILLIDKDVRALTRAADVHYVL